MSFTATAIAWKVIRGGDLSCHETVVLLVMADRANELNECWPSISGMASDVSISESSVKRAVKGLVDKGFIKAQRRPNKCTKYTMLGEVSVTLPNSPERSERPAGGVSVTPEPITEPINTEQVDNSEYDLFHQHKTQHCEISQSRPVDQVDLNEEFEKEFWPRYRKHRPAGKQNAKAEWKRARKKHTKQEILSGLTWWEIQWKRDDTDNTSKPWAERFLKYGRYLDAKDDVSANGNADYTDAPCPRLDDIKAKRPDLWELYEQGNSITVNHWCLTKGFDPHRVRMRRAS